MKRLPIGPLAECLDIPPLDWVNRCSEISIMAVEMGCIAGSPIYGTYYGPVGEDVPIKAWIIQKQQGVPIRHGWIRQPGGVIVDPTRWVFEGSDPYVALISASDVESRDYDPGSQRLKRETPPPARGSDNLPGGPPVNFGKHLTRWSQVILQDRQGPPYTFRQLMWLANQPPVILGLAGGDFYEALIAAGHRGIIPKDYMDLVFPNYTEEAFGLPEEHRELYTVDTHKCPKCQSTMDECLDESCETDVCSWECGEFQICDEHMCQYCDELVPHRCTHCLTVYCDECDDSECPKCETPSSRRSEC